MSQEFALYSVKLEYLKWLYIYCSNFIMHCLNKSWRKAFPPDWTVPVQYSTGRLMLIVKAYHSLAMPPPSFNQVTNLTLYFIPMKNRCKAKEVPFFKVKNINCISNEQCIGWIYLMPILITVLTMQTSLYEKLKILDTGSKSRK